MSQMVDMQTMLLGFAFKNVLTFLMATLRLVTVSDIALLDGMLILSIIFVLQNVNLPTSLIILHGDVCYNAQSAKIYSERLSTILVWEYVLQALMHPNKISNV